MSEMVAKLDDYGRPAWIAVMIAGFILFWPIGLAVLGYLIWSGRMTCGRSNNSPSRWQSRFADKFEKARSRVEDEVKGFSGSYSSGNRAFDDYRDATLKRLEQEEREFREFLARLRQAKDKSEFDAFMSERRERPQTPPGATPATDQPQV
ncbi:MAG: DUF2852 domain-containing protein [Hyphomicrobium sp.]|nr:DUF2852 domain-containing protein [Hyphomicrobium sp.]